MSKADIQKAKDLMEAQVRDLMAMPTTQVKKNKTSFMIYNNEVSAQIREENPGLGMAQISKIIGQKWQELTDQQKQIYTDKAQQDKARYENDVEIEKQNNKGIKLITQA